MKIFVTGGSGFIGTNFIDEALRKEHTVLNYDNQPPLNEEHLDFYESGDVCNRDRLLDVVGKFLPDVVVHFAARVECDENTTVEEGYRVNTLGTQVLLEVINCVKSVKKLVMTSSQYVCGPGRQPINDDDYFPHTVYGKSKVITEQLTRSADLSCCWFLIRPVNIWGPYHERYRREFWRIAASGLYLHPNIPAPVRTYGYVGNVVWQIFGLITADEQDVCGKVFYVGDQPRKIDEWSLGFVRAFRGKEPIHIPMWMMAGLGKVGDLISLFIKRPFFITSPRLRSMTEDYLSPIDKTEELLGKAPWTLEEGIAQTVTWFQAEKLDEKG